MTDEQVRRFVESARTNTPKPVALDAEMFAAWLDYLGPDRAAAVLAAAKGGPAPAAPPGLPAAPTDDRPRVARYDQRAFVANLEAIARGDVLVG